MRVARVFLALFITGSLLVVPFWLGFGKSGASPNNDTLSAYYKLDEAVAGTAADSSGDGNPGTVTGATASTDVPVTTFGNSHSLSFDGDDYIEIADSAELNPSELTLSAWVKFNSLTGVQTIAAKWDTSFQQQYNLQASDDKLRFYIGNGSNTSSDFIESSVVLSTGVWYHVVGTVNASTITIGVNGTTDSDVADAVLAPSVNTLTIGAKQNNDGPYFEFLNGLVDDVRLYSRVLEASELADLAAGDHTSATWDGSDSADYDTPGNWDNGAVPDPYTYVTVAQASNNPVAGSAVAAAGLSIDSGARLNLAGNNLDLNDSGIFSNDGTLQLKNSETLTGFTNDTDSGTIMLTPDADISGFKTGNSFNNLIINDGTFAYWPLDESVGPAADFSGFGRDAAYQGAPVPSAEVPSVNFADDRSLEFDGTDDHLSFPDTSMPNNATYCGWLRMDSGSGVVIGSDAADHYALKINTGTQVAVRNAADGEVVTWDIPSVYGSWHHICLAQTDNTVSFSLGLYVDGQPVGSTQVMSSGVEEINSIGRGGSSYFDGLIDDVRIYSRNLTPTEIGLLYDGEQPATYSSTQTLDASIDVGGDLILSSGRLDVSTSNYDISVAGNLRNDGGVLVPRSGTVTLDGDDQSINSSFSFFNLTKNVGVAATLTFGQSSTTTVANQLTLAGTSGNLLSLRSSTPGTQWNLDPAGDEAVSYLDVQDSNNISVDPVDITDDNVTDSGNNNNWTVNVAPDTPTGLGPTGLTDGSFTTETFPTLDFTLADNNPGDQLRYQIQIDDNSDFSSPVVDYISDPGAHGARSYTVGQNGGDDTYLTGADDMMLSTANYYWRVKAIDDYSTPHESAYETANGGDVAFMLDVTGPTAPGQPATASPQTERKPTWTWTPSADSGSGLDDPAYTLQWSIDQDFSSGVSAAQTNNLSFMHSTNLTDGQWYFRVRATDNLGNHSAWSVSEVHMIDNTGPTTPVAPFTASPTSITTPTWSWAAPTDAGSGLDPEEPYILNWSLTSNFSGTVYNTTSSTNIFTHSTELGDGTWYLRVRAVDALGNQSAWSANGTVLIDGSPPTLPGAPQTTDPTNDNTPEWTWDASLDTGAGLNSTPYTVQWSSESDFVPLAGSTTSTTNSYTHGTPLADGTWYIRVSAKDALNNQSGYSATGQTTVDTVAPDVPEAPVTTTPTNDDTPSWTWAVPADTGVGLSAMPYTVQWSQDSEFGTVTGSETTATNSFTQSSSLAEGTWYFRVSATDAAGNTSSYSANGEVYIDITPPTVPGDPSTADPVNDNTPEWTWLVSTDSGIGLGSPAYEVEWSEDNTFTTDVLNGTATANSFTHTDGLSDGTWYFRIRAIDAVGNASAWSNAGSKVVDINPPTVPGTPATASPTPDNTPEWTWTASTDAGVGLDETPYIIEWSQDEDFLLGVVSETIANNNFTHPNPLADGTWYFRVKAQDDVGNTSEYSPVGSVFIDATAPTTPGTPSTATPTIDVTPTWSWSASSDGAGTGLAENGYIIEWSTASDLSLDMQATTSTTNSFTHTDPLADGTWYFRVRAIDAVGNESADSEIASVEVDDTPPSVPGTPSTSTPTDNDTPTWSWSASTDNGVGLINPAYELQWSQDEGFETGVLSGQVNTNEFTHTDPLSDGIWYFRVRASDNLDNTSAFSASGSVLISTDGPSVPGLPETDDPTTDTTPSWTWTASTSDAGLENPPYYIEWSTDTDFLINVFSDTSVTNGFTHTDTLADGTWYFRVRALDNTGIFSPYSDSGSVLVDTTAPTTPSTASTATPTNDQTPAWSWSASADNGVGLANPAYELEWSEDNTFNTGISNATAVSSDFTHTDPLADGTWYFRVRAVDGLNNTSEFSSAASVVIDATAPTIPGAPDADSPTNDQTPTWTWGASTDDGVGLADPAYELQWSQSSDFSSGISNETTNSTNFTHAGDLSDGTWYFRVRAIDEVSNYSEWSPNGSVEVDSSVPSAPGTPTTGSDSTNDDTPTWSWSASTDSGVGLASPGYQVEWSQSSDFSGGVSSDNAAADSFTHGSALSQGTWYFRVRAVDAVGNQSGWSGAGSVFIDTDTPTSPGTPSTTPTPTNDQTPAWTWSASTDDGFGFGDEPYEVQWSQDSSFASGVENSVSAEETYTHSSDLSDGTWHFRVRAVDDAGNQSSWSAHGSVEIDASAPSSPANVSTATPTKDPTPTWTWDASTDDGVGLADPAYELQWSQSSSFASGVSSTTTNDPNFTHTTDLGFGTWYFRIQASDSLGNKTSWVQSSVYIDNDPPVITVIKAVSGSGGAVVSWTTDEIASTRVEYGAGGGFSESTTETDTSPRKTSHSVTLTGLPSCSTFQFRVISIDQLENEAVSSAGEFTTTACSGNAAIMGQVHSVISGSGKQLSLTNGSASMRLDVPSGVVSEDTDFQIKQLSPAAAINPIGQPSGRSLVGSHIYDLKAIKDGSTIISSFNGSLNATIGYTADEADGFTETSFAIFRHDGSSWQQLDGCNVNAAARVVSCPTSNFSVFGLFGVRAPDVPEAELPEGGGTVEPDPIPETATPDTKDDEDQGGQAEAASDNRGISAAVTEVFRTIIRRPVWWASLLLLAAAITTLILLKKRRLGGSRLPYGIHKDEK